MQKRISSYIKQFNEVFNGNPWVDETFAKKLDSLTEDQAFKKAPDNNHSAAEVVSHIIVWRAEVLRRLNENTTHSNLQDESPENWKDLALLRQQGWQQLYEDFKASHYQVIHFLQYKEDEYLDALIGDSVHTTEYYIAGLLQHDLYHLGQIGLILKWAK